MSTAKTNKAMKKRVKITGTGKLVTRVKGQNHFNMKKSGERRIADRRMEGLKMKNKDRARFLPHD